jgi:TnpA family transposase
MTQGASPAGPPRRGDVALPEDPSEEELARNWTLSETDRSQVLRCRGDDNRRRFAIQLCVLRQYGRFLEDYARIPVRILNHVNRQIHLPPALSLTGAERNATETEHHERLREYLGYRLFDAGARSLVEEHLRSRVSEGALASDLVESAEDALRFWKIILPSASTLERLAASVAATGRQEILERIAAHVADSTRKSLDALLEVAQGERQSGLMIFKEYPPEASPAAILAWWAAGISEDTVWNVVRAYGARVGKPALTPRAWGL